MTYKVAPAKDGDLLLQIPLIHVVLGNLLCTSGSLSAVSPFSIGSRTADISPPAWLGQMHRHDLPMVCQAPFASTSRSCRAFGCPVAQQPHQCQASDRAHIAQSHNRSTRCLLNPRVCTHASPHRSFATTTA